MQKLQVIGNICNDLALEETPSGKSVLKFSIAVKRDYVRGESERKTDFFNAICWNQCAENVARYCKKGDKIYLEGKLEQRSYEDNQGIKRTAYDYIIDKTEFLGTKKDRSEETEEDYRPAKRQRPTMREMDDDAEIPF